MSDEQASPVPEGADAGSVSERSSQPVALTCSGCTSEWTGLGRAHCAAKGCHRTFSGVSAFDRHRDPNAGEHGACLDPVSVGLVEREGGLWGAPAMTREQIEKAWPKSEVSR